MIELPGLEGVALALRQHRIVLIRGLPLSERAQIRLAARLGALVGSRRGVAQVRYEDTAVEDPIEVLHNERWHADLSWTVEGPALTVLAAVASGPGAPATDLLDTVPALAALDAGTRAELSTWEALHDVQASRAGRPSSPGPSSRRGLRDRLADLRRLHHRAVPPAEVPAAGARHRVVQRDPGSSAPYALLGDHAWTLATSDERAGRAKVADAMQRLTTVVPFTRHEWRTGDVLILDNRSVLHRRQPMDAEPARRVLRRCAAWPIP